VSLGPGVTVIAGVVGSAVDVAVGAIVGVSVPIGGTGVNVGMIGAGVNGTMG
jgi:hypothetical protein